MLHLNLYYGTERYLKDVLYSVDLRNISLAIDPLLLEKNNKLFKFLSSVKYFGILPYGSPDFMILEKLNLTNFYMEKTINLVEKCFKNVKIFLCLPHCFFDKILVSKLLKLFDEIILFVDESQARVPIGLYDAKGNLKILVGRIQYWFFSENLAYEVFNISFEESGFIKLDDILNKSTCYERRSPYLDSSIRVLSSRKESLQYWLGKDLVGKSYWILLKRNDIARIISSLWKLAYRKVVEDIIKYLNSSGRNVKLPSAISMYKFIPPTIEDRIVGKNLEELVLALVRELKNKSRSGEKEHYIQGLRVFHRDILGFGVGAFWRKFILENAHIDWKILLYFAGVKDVTLDDPFSESLKIYQKVLRKCFRKPRVYYRDINPLLSLLSFYHRVGYDKFETLYRRFLWTEFRKSINPYFRDLNIIRRIGLKFLNFLI